MASLTIGSKNIFPAANLNDEYRMTLDEFLTRVGYLVHAIDAFDAAAGKD